jgi:hypothetical protein
VVYDNTLANPLVANQPTATTLISPLIQDRPRSASFPRSGTNIKPHKARADVMQTFAPQPAIDPILYGTSQFVIHRMAAARGRIAPSLEQLEKGPPPVLLDNSRVKEWTVPKEIRGAMDGMSHTRHVELLTHCESSDLPLLHLHDTSGSLIHWVAQTSPTSLDCSTLLTILDIHSEHW